MSTKFSPTHAELAFVSQIFAQADPKKLGILTGDVAVNVFGGAKLPPSILGEIWSIADEDNNGWLPRKGVAVAVRLMGWAQKGEKITQELVHKPGPLPTIDGVTAVAPQNVEVSLPKSPPASLPLFTAQEKTKFQNLFTKAGPGPDGLLSGTKARDVFLKSGLSNDTLLQIWNLADSQDRGALDSTDFAIGMYFIQGLMSGQLSFVPTSLPPGLYQQVGGQLSNNQGSVKSHMSGNGTGGSFSPLSGIFPSSRGNIQPQHTGQSQLLQPDYTGLSAKPSKPHVPPLRSPSGFSTFPFGPQHNGHVPQWDVPPSDKAASDRFFDELDPQKRGYIEGEVAVPFMLKSDLPGEELARVWDLADLNSDGRLSRDGFAVAMHLIQKRLMGTDIPDYLPSSLIPPSMRVDRTSLFSSNSSHPPPEPVKDLLWDDTPPVSASQTRLTGPALSVSNFAPIGVGLTRDPFASSPPASTPHRDLLSDDEDDRATPSRVHDQSAEIGNIRNQLSSTNRSTDALKAERTTLEQTLANQASQLSALQTQLSSAKAACETETKLLAALKERHVVQASEMQKTREELIRAESDLSAVRVEKSEVEGVFMRDKEDARELHRKMVEVGQQMEALKVEVEKMKKDAKQQKGLLAIARKQLGSKEVEKAKVEKELEEVNSEVASVTKEVIDAEAELTSGSAQQLFPATSPDSPTFAAGYTLPVSPDPSNSAGSIAPGKSNNPFERLSKVPSTPRSHPPFLPLTAPPIPTPGSINDGPTPNTGSDPFGFVEPIDSQPLPFENPSIISDVNATSRKPSPKLTSVDTIAANGTESVLSPGTTDGDSDHFVTPPTSAPLPTSSGSPSTQFSALNDLTLRFPEIQATDPKTAPLPLPLRRQEPVETDLRPQLQGLEVEESDSDSEDEVPLAELAKPKGREDHSPPPSPPPQSEAPTVLFDDIFGVSATVVDHLQIPSGDGHDVIPSSTTVKQPLVDQVLTPSSNSALDTGLMVAGVGAFDEAMGTIPSSSSGAPRAFTFDSAFDDNFDFASATKDSIPPTTVPNENKNGESDVIFSKSDTSTSIHTYESSPQMVNAKPTFDEIFSGLEPGPKLDLDGSFPSVKGPTNVISTQATLPSSPTSQAGSPSSPHTIVSHSPDARPRSPAPRVSSSPKPRPSTSSSKEGQEKPKDISPRHSKLSIRLPFGRRKKRQQQQQTPISSSHLAPPLEEMGIPTPAIGDDIEAVHQLTAMGFSRSDAISALERYGYDLQRALNSLLGTA